jgi:hypothetical protein
MPVATWCIYAECRAPRARHRHVSRDRNAREAIIRTALRTPSATTSVLTSARRAKHMPGCRPQGRERGARLPKQRLASARAAWRSCVSSRPGPRRVASRRSHRVPERKRRPYGQGIHLRQTPADRVSAGRPNPSRGRSPVTRQQAGGFFSSPRASEADLYPSLRKVRRGRMPSVSGTSRQARPGRGRVPR